MIRFKNGKVDRTFGITANTYRELCDALDETIDAMRYVEENTDDPDAKLVINKSLERIGERG